MVEERMAIIRKGAQAVDTTAGEPVTEDAIITANKKWNPYNPRFNRRVRHKSPKRLPNLRTLLGDFFTAIPMPLF
jgi:hypothetical protein